MKLGIVRFYHPDDGVRIGVQQEDTIYDVTDNFPSIETLLQSSVGRIQDLITELEVAMRQSNASFKSHELDNRPDADTLHWLAPVDEQEVWASGVTYERSREARQIEAVDGGDVYARVYSAKRPELFMKAAGWRVIGHLGEVGIRHDATWSVPEPELALVLNSALEVVGFTIGNDMSSRDIEGENPLYLPQAKVYTASCALGTRITLQPMEHWPEVSIHLNIFRDDGTVFAGSVSTSRIHRKMLELIDYLGRAYDFPSGAILLTGTGLVPGDDFTLQAGDIVEIEIDGFGKLRNTVKVV